MEKLKYVIRCNCFGMYNCAMAIFSNMEIRSADGQKGYCYAEPAYLIKHKDEIIQEFLEYLNEPPAKDEKSKIPGVIAHYKGHSRYTKLPFYVFHDNVKTDNCNGNPFSDMSSLMHYLYDNQKKYGITVTQSHMAGNAYHKPSGSHPGRVYVLSPPAFPGYVKGTKISAEEKKGISSCISGYKSTMHPEDVATLKSLL